MKKKIAKKAVICGVSGQDGSYLAELLISKGYDILGLTRDPAMPWSINIAHLENRLKLTYTTYDVFSLVDLLKAFKPTEVYNCASQTYVSKSWEMINNTVEAVAMLPCALLEAIVKVDREIRFFQASSCEIFSAKQGALLSELSPIMPGNPYGCSKAFAQNMVAAYRENYGIFAVNGILFHHESPRRNRNFASRKIVHQAVKIKLGIANELRLGNLDVIRDWGYAPDYIEVAYRMLNMDQPQDFVICSGSVHSLQSLVEAVFACLDLDYRKYVVIDESLFRYAEPMVIQGSNQKVKEVLSWTPRINFHQMLQKMVDYELKLQLGQEKDYSNENPFA